MRRKAPGSDCQISDGASSPALGEEGGGAGGEELLGTQTIKLKGAEWTVFEGEMDALLSSDVP